MNDVSRLKGLGYLFSILSIVLLGIVSWQSASDKPLLALCLAAGMLTSAIGMALRWISHRREQRLKNEEPSR